MYDKQYLTIIYKSQAIAQQFTWWLYFIMWAIARCWTKTHNLVKSKGSVTDLFQDIWDL